MAEKTFTAYRLCFTSPLHIGDIRPEDYGNSEQFIRSDTMMAAVIATLGKKGKIAADFSGALPFTISSIFPFTTVEDTRIYFFPKLMKRLPLTQERISFAKKIKKLKWLDKSYFEKQLGDVSFDGFGEKEVHLQGSFCTAFKLPHDGFLRAQVSQRVTIPRIRGEERNPEPFYMEHLLFSKGSGLFFLAEGSELDLLEEALDLLQHEGLGTDRTVGNGAFKWEKELLSLSVPDRSTHNTNLSLFCPESKAQLSSMLGDSANYDFLKRGGWITVEGFQRYRKKAVYMFTEGSIFCGNISKAGRKNINVTPSADFIKLPHQIWRSGNSLFLPVKM